MPGFGPAGREPPQPTRTVRGPARPPQSPRDGNGAGARGNQSHRHPLRAPSDARARSPPSRRPEPPAPSRSCRWCLALSAAAAVWQGPRSAALRCAMAPRRPGARRVRAGAGLGGTGSRGEQEAGPAAPGAAGRRRRRRRRRDRPLLLSSPHRVAAALPPPPPHGACAFLGALRLCRGEREHVLGSTSLKWGGALVPVNTVPPDPAVPLWVYTVTGCAHYG